MRLGSISERAKNSCRPGSENRACKFNLPLTQPNALVFLPACLPVRAAPARASAPLGVEQELLSARLHASVEASAQPHVEVSGRLGVEAEASAETHAAAPW